MENKNKLGPEQIDAISFALTKDDWVGAQVLFLIAEEHESFTASDGAAAFINENQPAEDFYKGLQHIHNTGLVEINDDMQISLTDSGQEIATKMLNAIS